MVHILVVDDDDHIRMNISNMIDAMVQQPHRLYQAANGLKAVETVCSQPIDIIFADVKMPVCTGIEMMQLLKNVKYTGQIIMISGFGDYALIRQAMKLGAVDYLLKPVVKGELVDLLYTCIGKLNRQRPDGDQPAALQDDAEALKAFYAQQYWMEKLISRDQAAIEEVCRQYGLDLDTPVKMCMLGGYLPSAGNETQQHELFSKVNQIFGATLRGCSVVCLQGAIERYWVVALAGIPQPSGEDGLFFSAIKKQFMEVAISDHNHPITLMGEAYQNCKARQDRFFYDMKGEIPNDACEYPYKRMTDQLVEYAAKYQFEEFSAALRTLFVTFCFEQPPVAKVKALLAAILYQLMTRKSRYISVVSKHKFTAFDMEQTIQDAGHATVLYKQMVDIMNVYMEDAAEHNLCQDDYAVRRVKNYIDAEYMNAPSLVVISQQLGLHPNYLSTLFKQKMGMTYTQYLRQKRIDRAKDLMAVTNMKLYEIAEMVGYKDNAHFYHAFKSATGMSPAEFKRTMV